MWMNNLEVLETVLLSKAGDTSTAATTSIAFTVFEGRQEVIRALLHKASCAKIGRTLVNFIRRDRQDDETGLLNVTTLVRHESDDKHSSFPDGKKNTTRVEEFLSRLRVYLLRIRVARKVGQDFLVSKLMVELQTLCREECPHSSNGLETEVFQRLWGMLEQQQARPTSSLSEDATTISKARNLMQQAVGEGGNRDREGGEKKHFNIKEQQRGEEFTQRPSIVEIVPSPADALPLLVLAEALNACTVVDDCLDFIQNNQKEVIGVARTLFDPAFDWASAVTRLAKWPRLAVTSLPPSLRTRQISLEFSQVNMTEEVREHGEGAQVSPCSFVGSGSQYERGVLLREGTRPSLQVERGQPIGNEKEDQSSMIKSVGFVDGNSSSHAVRTRVAQEGAVHGQYQDQQYLEMSLQPGDSLHNGSSEKTSWRPQPAVSPASSPALPVSLPQRQPLQGANCSGQEAIRMCDTRKRESESSTGDHAYCQPRYPTRTCNIEPPSRNTFPDETQGKRDFSYLQSSGEDQWVWEEGELDADDTALGLNHPLLDNHRRNNSQGSPGQVSRLRVESTNACNDNYSTSPMVTETASSSKESSRLTLVNPTPKSCAVEPFAYENLVLRERIGFNRTSGRGQGPVSGILTGHPPSSSRNMEAPPSQKRLTEKGLPGRTVDSCIAVTEREYESSCALARRRALLRVRLARQKSLREAAEAEASEQGFRAELRRNREKNVATLLQRTSERMIHSRRRLEISSRVNEGNGSCADGGNGECEPGPRARSGKPPVPHTKASRPPPLLSTTGTNTERDQQAPDNSEDNEDTPRQPFDVKPTMPGIRAGCRFGSVRNSRSGGTSAKAPVPLETTVTRQNKHHVTSPNFKTTLTSIVVKIDALYYLPNGCNGISEGDGHPNVEICTGASMYLLLEAGRLKHRTAAQRSECCKLGTCQATNCRQENSMRQSRAGTLSRIDAGNTDHGMWVFGETVVLHFPPKVPHGHWASPEILRVLVYSSTGSYHQSYDVDSTTIRDHHLTCDATSFGAACWALVGVATLPLHDQLAEGLNDGFGEVANKECTFSRSLEISVEGTENGLPIGWVTIGLCAD